MFEEINLDLHTCRLFGWEPCKSFTKVEEFARVLREGTRFPAVQVVQLNFLDWAIWPYVPKFDGSVDGGHHRAIAHYATRTPLRCVRREQAFSGNGLIHISEWSLYIEETAVCLVENYVPGKKPKAYTAGEKPRPLPF